MGEVNTLGEGEGEGRGIQQLTLTTMLHESLRIPRMSKFNLN